MLRAPFMQTRFVTLGALVCGALLGACLFESGPSDPDPGSNGSLGCCWSGAPATLEPTWDMDCTGSNEDEGTTYVSVKTPGGDTCEQYAIYGGY